jgi:uncharacterized membrane protein YphA (DoxX/SURF4 family)
MKMTNKKVLYPLMAFVLFVFLQSLPFKFGIIASPETDIIFSTIAEWMNSIGLGFIAPSFASYGGIAVGIAELIASILLIIPVTRRLGALMGLGVISGAIFFHLFTPLGVHRIVDETGKTDGGVLFYMACGVWICCALILFLTRKKS